MYLLYIDEAGDEGQSELSSHNYLLCALGLHEGQWKQLSDKVDKLEDRYFPVEKFPDILRPVEFHCYDVRHGNDIFRLLPPTERAQLLSDMYELVRLHRTGLTLFSTVVHKRSLEAGKSPLAVAFEDLYSRFDLLLRRFAAHGNPQKGILIYDDSTLRDRLTMQATKFQKIGTRWSPVKNVIEAPFFMDSKATRAVQASDFCASAVFQYYEHGSQEHFGAILGKFDREPATGKIHGLRHVTKESCVCPACAQRL